MARDSAPALRGAKVTARTPAKIRAIDALLASGAPVKRGAVFALLGAPRPKNGVLGALEARVAEIEKPAPTAKPEEKAEEKQSEAPAETDADVDGADDGSVGRAVKKTKKPKPAA